MDQRDYSFERYKILKHQRRLYFLLGVLLVAFMFSVFMESSFKIQIPKRDYDSSYIARISIVGAIFSNSEIEQNIKAMSEDDSIKAVIVSMNSPGGTVVGSENLFSAIRSVSKVKPVVTVVQDTALSGGYMASLASDCIFAGNTSMVGSIGVLTQYMGFKELAERFGIEVGAVKSSPLKATPNPFERVTKEMLDASQYVIDDMFDFFKELVKERRNMSERDWKRVIDARIFSGRQALALNLIDAIGQEEEAVKWLVEVRGVPEGLEVQEYRLYEPSKRSFKDSILGYVFGGIDSFFEDFKASMNILPKFESMF